MMIRYLCNREKMKMRDTGSQVSFFSEGIFFCRDYLESRLHIATLPTYLLGTLPYVPVVMQDALEIQYSYLLQKS